MRNQRSRWGACSSSGVITLNWRLILVPDFVREYVMIHELMHRREIEKLERQIATEHLALIPLALYFKEGRVKVELGVARGRKKADKRQAMAERDSKLEMAKALGRRMKGIDR